MADAINSLTDSISSLAVFSGIKLSKKPMDDDHLYGHGKLEAIISAFIGFSMISAVIFIINSVVNAFIANEHTSPSYLTAIASLIAITIKMYMYKSNSQVALQYNSQALKASAKDHKQDAFSTLGTFISIICAIIGNKLSINFLMHIEPIAAFIMSIIISKTAFEVLKEAYMHLTDAAPESDILIQIEKIAKTINGIDHIDWLKGRYVGRKILIDVAISIDGNKTIQYGHNLAESFENIIINTNTNIAHVLVHVNPTQTHNHSS